MMVGVTWVVRRWVEETKVWWRTMQRSMWRRSTIVKVVLEMIWWWWVRWWVTIVCLLRSMVMPICWWCWWRWNVIVMSGTQE